MKQYKIATLILAALLLSARPNQAEAGIVGSVVEGIATEPTQIMNNIELGGINISQWLEIAQQLIQLEHEVEMINNQLKNLETYGYQQLPFINELEDLSDVVEQGQILSYVAQNIDAQFASKYPGYVNYRWQQLTPAVMRQKYQNWSLQNARNVKTALRAAHVQEETILDEKTRLREIQWLSQSSDGRLKAIQAGNMVSLEMADSLLRLRQLVMVNSEMHANYMANEQDKEDMDKAKWEQMSTAAPTNTTNGTTITGGIQ